jgi:hypothetical protein
VHNGQAEAGAAGRPVPGLVGAVEALEDAVSLLRAHAGPVVLDVEHHRRGA